MDADIGPYSFRVEFTDQHGNTSEPLDLIDVLTIVNSEPTVNIIRPEPGTQVSPLIEFEATGHDDENSELNWTWDFGDGETSDEESPVHTYLRPGDYTVEVTVTDEDGGTDSDTVVITQRHGFPFDSDNDGLSDIREFDLGTDPENPDTDSDGVLDGEDFYPLDPSRWQSPLHVLFQIVLMLVVILTLIASFIAYRRLKKEGKKEVDK
jgi:hypothetical protein